MSAYMLAISSTRIVKPHALSYVASYDVASIICQALALEFPRPGGRDLPADEFPRPGEHEHVLEVTEEEYQSYYHSGRGIIENQHSSEVVPTTHPPIICLSIHPEGKS
jgi:hypothetical protein